MLRRIILNLLLILAMVIGSVTPIFAQDQTPDTPDQSTRVFLPAVSGGSSVQASEDDDEAAPVTVIEVESADVNQVNNSAANIRSLPAWISAARLDAPIQGVDFNQLKLSADLASEGAQDVIIRLSQPSVAEVVADAAVRGAAVSADEQIVQASAVEQQQMGVVAQLQQLDPNATVYGATRIALNAVLANTTLDALQELAKNPAVTAVRPVKNYELDLSETVPYIGASAVRDLGYDGSGVKVAVLDSGIDYTHAKLGGVGTLEAYRAAYGVGPSDPANTRRDGLFPTEKVVEGFDFVGEAWTGGAGSPPLAPDDDPIDFEGHGTHVADIIAGLAMPDPSKARVRVVHASPDAPAVDVLVNDGLAFGNVAFRDITGYATLPPATYNVKVVPAGATTPVVIEADLTLEAGKEYTVIAKDLLASIGALVLVDNNSAPAPGNAHVRFVHLSPDAPAVDIAVAGGGPVIFGNVSFGEESVGVVGAYTPVPAGVYDLEVRLAGTDTVVLPLPGIALTDGRVYTAYAFGLVGDGTLGAGLSIDNSDQGGEGVAPGASLYAVKVCSAVSSACSGVALIQAMDYILDPNGDGDTSDRVDIVNMSLGALYGQSFDDDLSQAVEHASALGVLTIASAGNSSDKPYVTGTPAAAPSALSVAQTSVPSAFLPLMQVLAPASIVGQYQAVFQPWSAPLVAPIEAPLQYGNGAGLNLLGCDPFPAGSLSGRIVLVDRGACAFSIKISNIAAGGGIAGIIGLVAPGEPFEGGFGGGDPSVPGFMISQADANRLKSGLAAGVVVRFDPAVGIALAQHMVGSSSRGPAMSDNIIKPEIGAPGASISAVAGSGTGTEPFGGTSGAAPMVSGAAALLKQAYPHRTIYELKGALVSTAETNIRNRAVVGGGPLAPITRIGGGEVRVDRALKSTLIAYEAEKGIPALSFGFHEVTRNKVVLSKWVAVRNYSLRNVRLNVSSDFRFAEDAANGAVTVRVPRTVNVRGNDWGYFQVKVEIDGAKLPDWDLNSGALGASGDALTAMEFDGYITMTDANNSANRIQLPWQVLPRKAADVTLRKVRGGDIRVRNRSVGAASVESYSLIGISPNLPQGDAGEQNPTPDFRYLGYATYPVPAGFCSANPSFLLAFAVNTWERQTHANAPLSIEIYLDTDQNGAPDYLVINRDVSLNNLTDGRNLTWVVNLSTGNAGAFFFTDHNTNSGNTVLVICGEQIGMNAANFFQPINLDAFTTDIYFGGDGDSIEGVTIAPLGERYLGIFQNGGIGFTEIAPRQNDLLTIEDTGVHINNTENGLLLLYRPGAPGSNEAGVVIVKK